MIAIAGGKGGCGKTTTTVAVARSFVTETTTPVIGVEGDWDMPDLYALARTAPLKSVPVHSVSVDALNGRRPLAGFTVLEAPSGADRAERRQVFERIQRLDHGRSPRMVIDCPAGAGRDAAVPIDIATHVLLVSTAEPDSLRDTAKTAAMATELDTPIIGAVLTGTDRIPEGTRQLLGTDWIIPIPDAGEPLRAPEVGRAYRRVVDGLESVNVG